MVHAVCPKPHERAPAPSRTQATRCSRVQRARQKAARAPVAAAAMRPQLLATAAVFGEPGENSSSANQLQTGATIGDNIGVGRRSEGNRGTGRREADFMLSGFVTPSHRRLTRLDEP